MRMRQNILQDIRADIARLLDGAQPVDICPYNEGYEANELLYKLFHIYYVIERANNISQLMREQLELVQKSHDLKDIYSNNSFLSSIIITGHQSQKFILWTMCHYTLGLEATEEIILGVSMPEFLS